MSRRGGLSLAPPALCPRDALAVGLGLGMHCVANVAGVFRGLLGPFRRLLRATLARGSALAFRPRKRVSPLVEGEWPKTVEQRPFPARGQGVERRARHRVSGLFEGFGGLSARQPCAWSGWDA